MRQLWLRTPLALRVIASAIGIVVGVLCVWAGWRTDQWSLALLGGSQVVLWSVKAASTVHQSRRFPPPY